FLNLVVDPLLQVLVGAQDLQDGIGGCEAEAPEERRQPGADDRDHQPTPVRRSETQASQEILHAAPSAPTSLAGHILAGPGSGHGPAPGPAPGSAGCNKIGKEGQADCRPAKAWCATSDQIRDDLITS